VTSFFHDREKLIPLDKPNLNPLQETIFNLMFKNTTLKIRFYHIPANRVIELGCQFEV
jgi:KUP system potassium uptake protein